MFRILHIDDEEVIRMFLAEMLQYLYQNVEVVSCECWSDAKKELEVNNHFDVVFLDEVMPEKNGSDIYQIIQEKYPQLVYRVVFLTGSTNVGGTNRPYISKPFEMDSIKSLVDELLGAQPNK